MGSPQSAFPLSDDLALLEDAARRAGALAMTFFRKDIAVWDKSRGHPVSEADMAVDRFLKSILCEARPNYGWLSEESKNDESRLRRERVFVVDPIDGTRAFLRGEDQFTVAIAVVGDSRPLSGVVYRPATGDLYSASGGRGARRNGEEIAVSAVRRLTDCTMLADEQFFRAAKHWPVPWPEMRYRKVNSIALRLSLVAEGALDAMVSIRRKSEWDMAAADIIVHEAGGFVVDETGRPPRYNQERPIHDATIAAPPALVEPALKRVRPAVARRRAGR